MIEKTESEIIANWKYHSPPLVSCCCVTFNHERFISAALDSMLEQETDFPFEILVRDDCSEDKTAEIVKQYALAFPNIVRPVFERTNQFSRGVRPLPQLLKRTEGTYVALLDGDDYWRDTKKLQLQANFLENSRDYVVSHHNSIVVGLEPMDQSQKKLLYEDLSDYDGEAMMCMEARLITGTVMFRSSAYRHMAVFDTAYNGDTVFWHQLGFHGKAKFQPEIRPSAYRQHAGGVWTSCSDIQRLERSVRTRLLIKTNLTGNQELQRRAQRAIDESVVFELTKHTKSLDFVAMFKTFYYIYGNKELSGGRISFYYFRRVFLAVIRTVREML